jgi:lysophospholipase
MNCAFMDSLTQNSVLITPFRHTFFSLIRASVTAHTQNEFSKKCGGAGMGMVHNAVGKFNVNQRTELFYRRFIPSKPSLVLVFIHGAGQHSGQFVDLGRYCLQHNIAFYAFDLRGFGQSTGKRGHVHSFYEYLDDMHKFIGFVREVHPGEPIFLLGHSLGGTIVARYGQEYVSQVQGAIFSSPALRLRFHIPKSLYLVCHFLSFLTPRMSMDLNQWCNLVTRVCRLTDTYTFVENDPLFTCNFSVRWVNQLLANGQQALRKARNFQMATLCLGGTNDPLVDPVAVQEFYDSLQVKDKKFVLFEANHELLQEDSKEIVYESIIEWLKCHL